MNFSRAVMEEIDDKFETKYQFLGADVNALTFQNMLDAFQLIIAKDKKKTIVYHNIHSVYLINKYPHSKKYWEQANITFLDSVPLLWWAKFLGYRLKNKNRITFIDWLYPLLKIADKNSWKIFYLGSKPGVADRAISIISSEYENIKFKRRHGFFNADIASEENKKIVEDINAFQPHILMVGMGMPRQEKWIAENAAQISANAILGCGAGFEFITGDQKIPPRFLANFGLEWFYRFLCDPGRLFKRYFIEPLSLIPVFYNDFKEKCFKADKR